MEDYDISDISSENMDRNNSKRLKQRKGQIKKKVKTDAPLNYFDDDAEESSDGEDLNEEMLEKHRKMVYYQSRQTKNNIWDQDEKQIDEHYNQMAEQQDQSYDEEQYEDQVFDMLLPGQNDPKIFSVEVFSRGQESLLAFQLLKKFSHVQRLDDKFQIYSVSSMTSQPGLLFIEAFRKTDVAYALKGIAGIKMTSLDLVKSQGIPKIFTVKDQEIFDVKINQFVLIKPNTSMPYGGDVGQVVKTNNNNTATVIMVKRVGTVEDQNDDNDDINGNNSGNNRFKKFQQKPKYTMEKRPERELGKYLEKTIGMKNLITDFDLTQYKQELMDIKNYQDFTEFYNDYKGQLKMTESFKTKYKEGDKVKIFRGDLQGLTCKIKSVEGSQAKIVPMQKELAGEVWEVSLLDVMKYFKIGEHIQVIGGRHLGVTGQIVKIDLESYSANIATDNHNSIRVNCDQLVKSEKRNIQTTKQTENLQRLDLIKLVGYGGTGIILKIAAEYITILDSENQVQNISRMQFDSKMDTKNNTFKTHRHDIIKSGSQVTMQSGRYQGFKAQVKHVYKDVCFLFSSEFNNDTENIVVERSNLLQVQSKMFADQRKQPIFRADNISNEPRQDQQPQQQRQQQRDNGPKPGTSLYIKGGPYKGCTGIIKQISGQNIMIEIPSKQKTVVIPRSHIEDQGQQSQNLGQTPSYNPQSIAYQASPNPRSFQTPIHESSPVYKF